MRFIDDVKRFHNENLSGGISIQFRFIIGMKNELLIQIERSVYILQR